MRRVTSHCLLFCNTHCQKAEHQRRFLGFALHVCRGVQCNAMQVMQEGLRKNKRQMVSREERLMVRRGGGCLLVVG